MMTEAARSRARRRRWADIVVIVAGAYTVGMGIWAPPITEAERAAVASYTWWWLVLFFAGGLAFFSPLIAMRSTPLARVAVGVAAMLLLSGFVVFQAITAVGIATLVLPALAMLAAVPFLGPMPTPEEEGIRR